MSEVPPGTKVTPGTRGEPLAYVTSSSKFSILLNILSVIVGDGIVEEVTDGGVMVEWRWMMGVMVEWRWMMAAILHVVSVLSLASLCLPPTFLSHYSAILWKL